MTQKGDSASLRKSAFALSSLRYCSSIFGLLAGASWMAAGFHPVELDTFTGSFRNLPTWWPTAGIMAGIAIAGLIWLVWTIRGPAGLCVVSLVFLGTAAAGTLCGTLLLPTPNPIHPLGPAVPYGIAGFAFAGFACLIPGVAISVAGGWSAVEPNRRPTSAIRPPAVVQVLAFLTALPVVAGAAIMAVAWGEAYLLDVNGYRTTSPVELAPAPPPISSLTGGDRWRVTVPGLVAAEPAVTTFGLAMSSGDSVVLLDRATGTERWRYTRSDVTGIASVASADAGSHVLVSWPGRGVFVLDARTGRRVGYWKDVEGRQILDAELPLIAQPAPGGRTTVSRVSAHDGKALWTYQLGDCRSARATPSGDVIVLQLAGCGDAPDRIAGLEAATGRERWTVSTDADLAATVNDLIITLSPLPPGGGARQLTAIRTDDGRVRWQRAMPQARGPGGGCQNVVVRAAARLAVVACDFDLSADLAAPRSSAGVYVYDSATGAQLRDLTYADGGLASVTVTAGGRALATHGDWDRGCVLETAPSAGTPKGISIEPGQFHECAQLLVVALDEQVLVLNPGQELIRSLR